MTTPEKTHPKHLSFNATLSFDLKSVIAEKHLTDILNDMQEIRQKPERYSQLSVTDRVFFDIVLQKPTLEEKAAALIQWKVRTGLNELLKEEFTGGSEDTFRITPSPVKFRFHVNDTKSA